MLIAIGVCHGFFSLQTFLSSTSTDYKPWGSGIGRYVLGPSEGVPACHV